MNKNTKQQPQHEMTEQEKEMAATMQAAMQKQQHDARLMQILITNNFQVLHFEGNCHPGALIAGISAALADVVVNCTEKPVEAFQKLMNDRLKQVREADRAKMLGRIREKTGGSEIAIQAETPQAENG